MKIPPLSTEAIREIEATIHYCFVNKSLLFQAFRRSSYCNEQEQMHGVRLPSNEVLEFCGDSILGASVMTDLVRRYGSVKDDVGLTTSLSEGDLSAIKSNLSDKSMLSRRMESLGLHRFLLLSHGDRNQGIENTASVKEDLFESIIGAVYLDSGDFEVAKAVCAHMLDPKAYLSVMQAPKNPKNLLQELCQKRRLSLSYETLSVTGPENAPTYTVRCVINGTPYATATAQNQKTAEIEAARATLPLVEQTAAPTAPSSDERAAVSRLKEWDDRHKSNPLSPAYTAEEAGEDGQKQYRVLCHIHRQCYGVGIGYSKKEAKEAAARAAIEALQKDGILID